MSTETGIQWTDHTFNPWWGCAKVHSGCANCYAESLDTRWGGDHWGKDATRRMVLGEWGKPERWNQEALATFGRPARVFCASMCDLFEDFNGFVVDQQGKRLDWTVDGLRRRVFGLIEKTPNLEWQLLTKRPENVRGMVPLRWLDNWPANVIVGTSPCDQATADKAIPALLKVPGRKFLSAEPLLGGIVDCSVDLTVPWAWPEVDWVIVGCESNGKRAGRNADGYRDHAQSILAQCLAANVPVFHKQMPIDGNKSGNPDEWPEWARVRQFPTPHPSGEVA